MPQFDARAVFATRLKAARLASGLTQEGLGIRAGIPEDVARTRVNRYEKAVHDADLATVQRLADALGVPLAALYAETEVMARAIQAFATLSPAEQRRVADELDVKAQARQDRSTTKKKSA